MLPHWSYRSFALSHRNVLAPNNANPQQIQRCALAVELLFFFTNPPIYLLLFIFIFKPHMGRRWGAESSKRKAWKLTCDIIRACFTLATCSLTCTAWFKRCQFFSMISQNLKDTAKLIDNSASVTYIQDIHTDLVYGRTQNLNVNQSFTHVWLELLSWNCKTSNFALHGWTSIYTDTDFAKFLMYSVL